ncbi:uncharacterized protein FPOAC1_013530 [Fusarium poae]|uniref:uncharacterized protein n=1 Tax=Fusarium poae TaxID=36050 RepID=UPI001D055F4A|nr:uncharacterized protein FPOAC1_013530 [Fusarium poae]KAG8664750.1 hypothetical protein FPOAC1_013530 [Fusarium poae]
MTDRPRNDRPPVTNASKDVRAAAIDIITDTLATPDMTDTAFMTAITIIARTAVLGRRRRVMLSESRIVQGKVSISPQRTGNECIFRENVRDRVALGHNYNGSELTLSLTVQV